MPWDKAKPPGAGLCASEKDRRERLAFWREAGGGRTREGEGDGCREPPRAGKKVNGWALEGSQPPQLMSLSSVKSKVRRCSMVLGILLRSGRTEY